MRRLPKGRVPTVAAVAWVKERLGLEHDPREDPAIILWAGAWKGREPSGKPGRPAEAALDQANAALLAVHPSIGPMELAVLEALMLQDQDEAIRFPTSDDDWTSRRKAVATRAQRRVVRAQAQATDDSSAGAPYEGTVVTETIDGGARVRLRIELVR